MMRLNKYLAECGVGSRRKCDDLIVEGRVLINDMTETKLGVKIDEKTDKVQINGKLLKHPQHLEYFILNKPKGYITTTSDEKGRKTVLDLVKTKTRIFPVGRLDVDTSGLLLLTNDGELSFRMTHPKFEVDKIYEVKLDFVLTIADRKKLESGVYLEEGITSNCKIEFPDLKNKQLLHITLHQGWKRQVRRMFAKLGYQVLELKRIGLASLKLNGLQVGEWREMTTAEVNHLKNGVGIKNGN
ncbi:MAG: pseudouridine synthase [bacterium]